MVLQLPGKQRGRNKKENGTDAGVLFPARGKVGNAESVEKILLWCRRVENGKFKLILREYEEKGTSDWIYEYQDPHHICHSLERIYEIAEEWVFKGDYEDAACLYKNVNRIRIKTVDEENEESTELDLSALVSEGAVLLDIKRIARLSLYAEYQKYDDIPQRVRNIYACFSDKICQKVELQEMFSAGPKELTDLEPFMEAWLSFLQGRREPYAFRLYEEAAIFCKGNDNLIEKAHKDPAGCPLLYKLRISGMMEQGKYSEILEEGVAAIEKMEGELEIRGKIAGMIASAAEKCQDHWTGNVMLWEAFYSCADVTGLLGLITGGSWTEALKRKAEERLEEVDRGGVRRLAVRENGEFLKHSISEEEYFAMRFLAGDFEYVRQRCRIEENRLEYSRETVEVGIPLMLILLYEGKNGEPALYQLTDQLAEKFAYEKERMGMGLWEALCLWKEKVPAQEEWKSALFQELSGMIDSRVAMIVEGRRRENYEGTARMAAAFAQTGMSRGTSEAGERTVSFYLKCYQNDSAFCRELQKFL